MNDGNVQSIAPITTIPRNNSSNTNNIGKISSKQDVATLLRLIDRNQPNAIVGNVSDKVLP